MPQSTDAPLEGGTVPSGTVPLRTSGSRARSGLRAAGDFLRRVYEKAGDDNIFFMAGAIAFNVIVAFFPLILAILGVAGAILRRIHADPANVLTGYLMRSLPAMGSVQVEGRSVPMNEFVQNLMGGLLDNSGGYLGIGTILLAWLATRLVGTLRSALREVFDLQQDLGIIAGKLFDLRIVLTAGTLFAVNVALTVVVRIAQETGLEIFGIAPDRQFLATVIAFSTIWVTFLLVYRYLPARRTSWRTSLVAATFTSVIFELMKQGFARYAAAVDYTSTYGGLSALIVLIFWIYYSAVVFILGGEVAQVVAMQRIRRRQKERLR